MILPCIKRHEVSNDLQPYSNNAIIYDSIILKKGFEKIVGKRENGDNKLSALSIRGPIILVPFYMRFVKDDVYLDLSKFSFPRKSYF